MHPSLNILDAAAYIEIFFKSLLCDSVWLTAINFPQLESRSHSGALLSRDRHCGTVILLFYTETGADAPYLQFQATTEELMS